MHNTNLIYNERRIRELNAYLEYIYISEILKSAVGCLNYLMPKTGSYILNGSCGQPLFSIKKNKVKKKYLKSTKTTANL